MEAFLSSSRLSPRWLHFRISTRGVHSPRLESLNTKAQTRTIQTGNAVIDGIAHDPYTGRTGSTWACHDSGEAGKQLDILNRRSYSIVSRVN